MLKPTTYRGFVIEDAGEPGYYFWLDEDTYDGPEGDDHGTERGVSACKRAIDEYIEENPEKYPDGTAEHPERCGSCVILTQKTDADHNPQCSRHGGR